MAFETISFEELRKMIAEWALLNCRTSPLPTSDAAVDFIEQFTVPDTELIYTQCYADHNSEVIALFKTAIRLHAWQTRNGLEPADFKYYKITKAVIDDDGKILDTDTIGYVVV